MLSWHCCWSLKRPSGFTIIIIIYLLFKIIIEDTCADWKKSFTVWVILDLIIGKQWNKALALKAAQSSLKTMCCSGCLLFTLTWVESESWSCERPGFPSFYSSLCSTKEVSRRCQTFWGGHVTAWWNRPAVAQGTMPDDTVRNSSFCLRSQALMVFVCFSSRNVLCFPGWADGCIFCIMFL